MVVVNFWLHVSKLIGFCRKTLRSHGNMYSLFFAGVIEEHTPLFAPIVFYKSTTASAIETNEF